MVVFVFNMAAINCDAQINVEIVCDNDGQLNLLKNEKLKFKIKDSTKLNGKLHEFTQKHISEGYLTAGFDTLIFDSTTVKAHFYLGEKFDLRLNNIENLPTKLLQEINYDKKAKRREKLSLSELKRQKELTVKYYENRGYPFAIVKTDSVLLNGKVITGNYKVEPNPLFEIDSIHLKGKVKISRNFLQHFLEIKSGELFDQSKVSLLGKRIEHLEFLKLARPVELEFWKDKADIYLYLEGKPANYFSGILGFSSGEEESDEILLTGDVNLFLVNTLQIAEEISIFWKRYNSSSQNLKINIGLPFLYLLPVGLDFNFGLEKFESEYLNTELFGGVEYAFNLNNKFKVYYQQKKTFLIQNDEQMPANLDNTSITTAGINFYLDKTDYRYNPGKGFSFIASSGYGTRKTRQKGASDVISFSLDAACYFKLGKLTTIAVLNKSAGIFNDDGFFSNEFFKLGGVNTLRGFDEKSIYASNYSVVSIEPRLLLDKKSSVFLLSDLAWVEQHGINETISNKLYSFGAGLNLDTRAGIFKLIYAVGTTDNYPLKLSESKVHFGYLVRF